MAKYEIDDIYEALNILNSIEGGQVGTKFIKLVVED